MPSSSAVPLPPDVRRVRKKYYPVPPVCHVWWTGADWERTAVIIEEPDVLTGSSGTWDWTGEYNEKDEKLYRLRTE